MNQKGLHFSIGTGPSHAITPDNPSGFDLTHDLRLIKAAVLYADGATLYSPLASMLVSMTQMKDYDQQQQLSLAKELFPLVMGSDPKYDALRQILRRHEQISRRPNPTRQERQLKENFERLIDFSDMFNHIEQQAINSKVDEVVRAVDSGYLVVYDFMSPQSAIRPSKTVQTLQQGGQHPSTKRGSSWVESLAHAYFDQISQAVSDGVTYPLFDDQSAGLVRHGLNEGVIAVSDIGINRGKHSGLVADLLERLPLFDSASVQDSPRCSTRAYFGPCALS